MVKQPLAKCVIALIEEARRKVGAYANLAQVYTNYEIGRQIVEDEQGGRRRAGYGEKIIEDLSAKQTERFGRGWSVQSLWRMRQFFLLYSDSLNGVERIPRLCSGNSADAACWTPRFELSWSHYLLLMRSEDPVERNFYEREAKDGRWTFRRLERMYLASTFERLEIAKDKKKVRAQMNRPAPDVEVAGT